MLVTIGCYHDYWYWIKQLILIHHWGGHSWPLMWINNLSDKLTTSQIIHIWVTETDVMDKQLLTCPLLISPPIENKRKYNISPQPTQCLFVFHKHVYIHVHVHVHVSVSSPQNMLLHYNMCPLCVLINAIYTFIHFNYIENMVIWLS